jgi:hypothetical protein
VTDKPIFQHDCDRCIFLGGYPCGVGGFEDYFDLYACQENMTSKEHWTLVLRYGNEGHQYRSGLVFAFVDLDRGDLTSPYVVALRRAQEKGVIGVHQFGYWLTKVNWDEKLKEDVPELPGMWFETSSAAEKKRTEIYETDKDSYYTIVEKTW